MEVQFLLSSPISITEGYKINTDILLLLENYSNMKPNSLIIKNCELLKSPNTTIDSILKKEIYISLFEEIFKKIELFSGLLQSFSKDILEFSLSMLDIPANSSYLTKISQKSLYNIFKYGDLHTFKLNKMQIDFISNLRDKNIQYTIEYINFLSAFNKHYHNIYNKIKHGYTIIDSLTEQSINGSSTIFIPVFYNTKNINKILYLIINNEVFLFWEKVYISLISAINIISNVNYSFIKRDCKHHIYGISFIPLSETESVFLKAYCSIGDDTIEKIYRYNIKENVTISELDKIKKLSDEYQKLLK